MGSLILEPGLRTSYLGFRTHRFVSGKVLTASSDGSHGPVLRLTLIQREVGSSQYSSPSSSDGGGGVNCTASSATSSGEIMASSDEHQVLEARCVVNSAGLHAQEVAASIAGLTVSSIPPLYYAKGNYFSLVKADPPSSMPESPPSLDQRPESIVARGVPAFSSPLTEGDRPAFIVAPFSRLIYPVPEPGGLGIHYTLDLAGRARFGPDVEWVNGIDYSVRGTA